MACFIFPSPSINQSDDGPESVVAQISFQRLELIGKLHSIETGHTGNVDPACRIRCIFKTNDNATLLGKRVDGGIEIPGNLSCLGQKRQSGRKISKIPLFDNPVLPAGVELDL